jgi:hypothetical protein
MIGLYIHHDMPHAISLGFRDENHENNNTEKI